MSKLLLLLLLFALFTLGCSSRSQVTQGEWPPVSNPPPHFEAVLPPLIIQGLDTRPYPAQNVLAVVDLAAKTAETEIVSGTGDLAASLAAEYRVVKNVLLDQQNRIYVIHSDRVSANGLWLTQQREGALVLRRVDDAGMLTLSGSGRSPVWSPDSEWLAYQDDAGLWLISLVDLSQQSLSSAPLEPLAWSPDGRSLLLRDDKNLLLMEIASQQQRTLNGVDASQIHGQPFWSADGQEIYTRYGENGRHTTDEVLARLVAIELDGSSSPIRDLLPVSRNRGVTHIVDQSPDGQALLVYHVHECGRRAQDLFPWPARYCTGAYLLVESANGRYETADLPALNQPATAWERPWPPVNLADLPQPPEPIFAPSEVAYTPQPLPTYTPTPAPPQVVPFGETAVDEQWALTLLEVVRGEAALAEMQSASPFSPPPPDGQEFILMHVRLQYTGSTDPSPSVWIINFQLLDSDGQEIERITTRPSREPAIPHTLNLAPGTSHEGWLLLAAPVGDDVTLRFRTTIGRQEALYLALPGEVR